MRMVTAGLALLALARAAAAQTGAPPPSYGASLPKELEGHQVRFFRTIQMSIAAKVPRAELQKLLPAGYTAQPLAGDKDAARIAFGFYFQQRAELTTPIGSLAAGTYGPADTMNVTTTTDTAGGEVVLFLDSERSTEASAALGNALYGPGSTRVASSFDMGLEQKRADKTIRVRAHVVDQALGQEVDVVAPSTDIVSTPRVTAASPVLSQRFLDGARPPKVNRLFKVATAADYTAVAGDGIKLTVPGGKLRLPGGSLTVLGVDASGTQRISRWFEVFSKLL